MLKKVLFRKPALFSAYWAFNVTAHPNLENKIYKIHTQMKRTELLSRLDNADKVWDVVVIGGGATGLGCAVDAASRGYNVALFEREDFA